MEGVDAANRFQLVRSNGELWLVDTRKDPNAYPEITESTFARMVCGTRRFGDTPFVKAVHVTHADAGYRAEYDRILRATVTFDSDKNAMQIDEAWLTHRISLSPRYVFGILSEHAQALLKNLENTKSTRGRVESLLMPILHTGDASMDIIAGKVGVSRQTLFRKAEGGRDDLRKGVGRVASDAGAALPEREEGIGERDGLSGRVFRSAAFSRACKRWTGLTPRALRIEE